MKLINKISLLTLLSSGLIIIIFGIMFYFILRSAAYSEAEEELYENLDYAVSIIESGTEPYYPPFVETEIWIEGENTEQGIATVMLTDQEDGEKEEYLQLTEYHDWNEKKYKLTIRIEAPENDELIWTINIIVIITFLAILFANILTNRLVSRKLLKPFNLIIQKITKYRPGSDIPVKTESSIMEFQILDSEIKELMEKINSDFRNLKEFTDNAAHEIQTPLGILKNKIELLIQNQNLAQEEAGIINDISKTINRMDRINKSLLLLSRIENRQFNNLRDFEISGLIEVTAGSLNEIAAFKNQKFRITRHDEFNINMDKNLAAIMISNLLNNMIVHGDDSSTLNIDIFKDNVEFNNTGSNKNIDRTRIFKRFYKGTENRGGSGLGLAIVYEICRAAGLNIEYRQDSSQHIFKIYREL